ncbi:MAG: S41 family peptidase [Paludibacter sp.]|nr:S41 family peptidase [Paludibacter sp.]
MKRIVLFLIFCMVVLTTNAKQPTIIHSNKKNITMMINTGRNGWTISPELKPDIYTMYSETEKNRTIKFITDIDSGTFIVKLNKPVKLAMVLNNKDTAHVVLNLSNKVPNTLSNEKKIYALSSFWSETKYNFAFIDRLTFDLDSLYQSYIPKVLATHTDYDFYDQMELFAASLKDLHSEVFYRMKGRYTDYIPLTARFFGDSLCIVNAREDLVKQFPLGSQILKINNLTTQEYMHNFVEPYVCSNYRPTVKEISASLLFGSDLSSKKITITYQTPYGEIRTNTTPRNANSFEGGSYVGPTPKRWNKPVELYWEKENIARLVFNTFYPKDRLVNLFESFRDTLYSAKGIIIDLRANGGGDTGTGWYLLKYMIKDPYFLTYAWQTRINSGVKKASGNYLKENADYYKNRAYQTFAADTIWIPDSVKRFNVPMAVLISGRTCSAAEDFLITIKERKDRPVFIGRPTMGSTGSPLVLDKFPENGVAKVCTRRVLFPYSQKPFNEGIVPDIVVDYTLNEYLNQTVDKDVAIAVELLTKQTK